MNQTAGGSLAAMIHTLLLDLRIHSPKLKLPPPPHLSTTTTPNLTVSCESRSLHCFPPDANPQWSGLLHSCPLTCGFRRPGHAPVTVFVCAVRFRPWFTAVRPARPSRFCIALDEPKKQKEMCCLVLLTSLVPIVKLRHVIWGKNGAFV